jgi:hypothetical protein
MNTAKGFLATDAVGGTTETDSASAQGAECRTLERSESADSNTEVVEAVLSWRDSRGDNALGRKEIPAGGAVALGENGDLMVPVEVLGDDRFEIVQVEVMVGSFVVRLSRVRAGTKIAGAPLEGLKRNGVGILVASALAHAAAFAVLAYVSPALGATEEDAYDRDNIALMQKLLNASAQEETEHPPSDATSTEGGNTSTSQPAQGQEGQAGKDTPKLDGKWAARGTATPETATLAAQREMTAAADFGLIGLLATQQMSDPNAPTVPWGKTLNGADDVSRIGHLFGGSLDDAMGVGGLGLTGTGLGGGGSGTGFGVFGTGDTFGGLGKCTGGGNCGGIGNGNDRLASTHIPRQPKAPRYGVPETNGHLPAEVIQRIVRQNDGRYRFCYQRALQNNPNLEGRVTVKFLISRDGSVGYAADGGSDIPDRGVSQCVVSAFQSLSFPAPDSGVVTVVYPITFSPGS